MDEQKLHGTVITYDGRAKSLDLLPCRNDLIVPSPEVDRALTNKKNIMFLPTSFEEYHEFTRVNGCQSELRYKLIMFGILQDGRQASVIIHDIGVYFSVRVPDGITTESFLETMKTFADTYGASYSIFEAKSFDKYERKTSPYIKLIFPSSYNRSRALKFIRESHKPWKTVDDDERHYERQAISVSNMSLGVWNEIKTADMVGRGREQWEKESKVKINILVSIANIATWEGDLTTRPDLLNEQTIVKTWDTEAFTTPESGGDLPNPGRPGDHLFMIGNTFHWKYERTRSFLRVVFTIYDANPHPDYLTIKCANEKDMLMAANAVHAKLRPDFVVGFNDGDFDWPFVIERLDKYGKICDAADTLSLFADTYTVNKYRENIKERADLIKRWKCNSMKTKIEAGLDIVEYAMRMPGYQCIDARTAFRKAYPKDPSGLKYVLNKFKLTNKEDMPVHEMFRAAQEAMDIAALVKSGKTPDAAAVAQNRELMTKIAHYCMIDAQGCQEIVHNMNIIGNARELAQESGVTLFDAINHAGGMKVRASAMRFARQRGILISSKSREYVGSEQYPGAYVVPPTKGLVKPKLTLRERMDIHKPSGVRESDIAAMEEWVWEHGATCTKSRALRPEPPKLSTVAAQQFFDDFIEEESQYPVAGLDFNSLYPSIIMAYNLSPEMMVFSQDEANALRAEGFDLHEISFPYSGTIIKAWSIRHGTEDGNTPMFGIYPSILRMLFKKRADVKAQMEKVKKGSVEWVYLNSKQLAIKLLMNTFYGEAGNKMSPLFMLALAGGVTTAGQRNLRLVHSFITTKPHASEDELKENPVPAHVWAPLVCRVYYGDTDSLYVSCPPYYFQQDDRAYYSGKMPKDQYMYSLIKKSFGLIEQVRKRVNEMLHRDNGTTFLKMAYEEELYPALFMMRKKYGGVEHKTAESMNLLPERFEDYFSKGLELNKRGVSEFMRTVSKECFMELLDYRNNRDVMSIVTAAIESVYSRKWNLEKFKQSASYKPSKNNVSVNRFKERMEARNDPNYPPPVAAERFEYVIVKKFPWTYDIRGRKKDLLVGDKIEYYTYAIKEGLEIDIDHYMSGSVLGQLAQFISYHPSVAVVDDDNYEAASKASVEAAKVALKNINARFAGTFKCKGRVLKQAYRNMEKVYKSRLAAVLKDGSQIVPPDQIKLITSDLTPESLSESLMALAKKTAEKDRIWYADIVVSRLVEKYGEPIIHVAHRIFKGPKHSILKSREMYAKSICTGVNKTIDSRMSEFRALFADRDELIGELINKTRGELKDEDNAPAAEINAAVNSITSKPAVIEQIDTRIANRRAIINELYGLYRKLVHVETILLDTQAIIDCLNDRIMKVNEGLIPIMPSAVSRDLKSIKRDAVQAISASLKLDLDF